MGPMEACRRSMADSWWTCYAAGAVLTSAYPLLYVPAASFMTQRKRSINKHLVGRTVPSNYWFVVVRSLSMIAVTLGWQLRYMATHAHVHWRAEQATLANTVGAFIGCVLVREFLGYWVHRANHSKLLYKVVHEAHHLIPVCCGVYDGLYAAPLDIIQAATALFSPIALLPSIHLLAILPYIVGSGFTAFVLNHCGREVRLSIQLPLAGRVVLYDNQAHDDHHVYRRGNYADMLPILDRLFGTEIKVQRRAPLPAQELWRRGIRRAGWAQAFGGPKRKRSSVLLRTLGQLLEPHPESVPDERLGAERVRSTE